MNIMVLESTSKTSDEVIRECADRMRKEGFIGDSFVKSCLAREHEMPTGLPVSPPVAIPHAFDESIVENCLCFAKLKNKVMFKRMDTFTDELWVNHVFCMAINAELGDYIGFLQNLIAQVQNAEFLAQCSLLGIDEVQQYLERNLNK